MLYTKFSTITQAKFEAEHPNAVDPKGIKDGHIEALGSSGGKKMKQCGVYVIRCTVDGREYVGSSVNMVKFIREHFYRLEKGIHRNPHLQQAFNKYGKDSFIS